MLKKSVLITYFVANPESRFYKSDLFNTVVGNIQRNPGTFRMREDKEKLSLRVNNINSVFEAFKVLQKLIE